MPNRKMTKRTTNAGHFKKGRMPPNKDTRPERVFRTMLNLHGGHDFHINHKYGRDESDVVIPVTKGRPLHFLINGFQFHDKNKKLKDRTKRVMDRIRKRGDRVQTIPESWLINNLDVCWNKVLDWWPQYAPYQVKATRGYERNHKDFLAVVRLMRKPEGKAFIKAYCSLITRTKFEDEVDQH
jgi:hypothetical protein